MNFNNQDFRGLQATPNGITPNLLSVGQRVAGPHGIDSQQQLPMPMQPAWTSFPQMCQPPIHPSMRAFYPPFYGYPMPIPTCPPLSEAKKVKLEITLLLNDNNIQDMMVKIPSIKILVDKGLIQLGIQSPFDNPALNPLEEQSALGRRSNPDQPNLKTNTDTKRVKTEPQPSHMNGNSKSLPEVVNEYEQFTGVVDQIITEAVKTENEPPLSKVMRQGTSFLGPTAFTKDANPSDSLSKQQNFNSINVARPNKDSRSANPSFLTERQQDILQFSFQKMNFPLNGSSNPSDPSRQCFERHRHTIRERISWEMEKVHQTHAKKVRDYWEKHESFQPYLFKRRQLLRVEGDQNGEIIELIDYSNKRIADGEVPREHEEESERSSYSNGEQNSQSSN